ncbi:IS1634-like element ISVa17 family transposase [Vibrio anguillarum]|uniref:IS1634-like element ISVa17 family transposase n=1 Tax=Vibrio anguillarum TaxID=55601 RepID=UPI0012FE3859|nr:IS1634-like element ISVa17 family transposase [Vibrio anguillarum]
MKIMTISYSTKSLDHLGLVSGMCKDIGIAKFIDDAHPEQSKDKHVSYGQLVEAMILNGLGFVGRTLYMYPEYFADRPVERLLGKGVKAEHINDDALGRCLDQLYETGVSDLFQGLSARTISHLKLPCEGLNLDSTSIHVDGEYKDEDGNTAIQLVRGYSRDHRPELNQVVLNLITENQAGIPVYMQAASGNINDNEGFKNIIKQHVKSLKAAYHNRYFIGDAALYTIGSVQSFDEQNELFISRVPQKLNLVKDAISEQHNYLFTELGNGYSATWIDSNYGGVKQRWLLVFSEQAKKREQYTLDKRMLKDSNAALKSLKKLSKERFACHADAMKMLGIWMKSQASMVLSEIEVIEHPVYHKSGRPKSGQEPDDYEYQVIGLLASKLNYREQKLSEKGLFMLATNDCSDTLTMSKMLELYKSQQSVEKGFRFLKSPDFLTSSLYLKKPERIEALLMIMTCCLMVYAALEHKIREELKAKDAYFPNLKYKPCQNPTARWVFFCFQGIDILTISENRQFVLNIEERNRIIIDCMGPTYLQIYS